MQKKTLSLLSSMVFFLAMAITGGVCIANDNGPADMVLQTASAKKPATFPHKTHQDSFKCGDCHHSRTENGQKSPYTEGMEIKNCATCHNKDDMDDPKMNNFKVVAHGLCKECHKKNKDSAPTKCSGCHIKKK